MTDPQQIKLSPLFPTEVGGEGPVIIAGPCSAESRQQMLETAKGLAANGVRIFRAGIWKPRTKPGCFEGVGAPALRWMQEVKETTGMLTATEVATPHHALMALDAGVDILWIGARTVANPFAMQELADTLAGSDAAVLVKNPVSPDLDLWIGAIERLAGAGISRLGAVHRGFSVYGKHIYRNMPQWSIPFELASRYQGLPIICDPSHITGRRDLVPAVAQQALDMGFDGLIIESHCNPDEAWSDAAQQITPNELGDFLRNMRYRNVHVVEEDLTSLRTQIDTIDEELIDLLARRMEVCRQIGQYKRDHNMKVVQRDRHDEVMRLRSEKGTTLGMPEHFIRNIFAQIHEESVRQQIRPHPIKKVKGQESSPVSSVKREM